MLAEKILEAEFKLESLGKAIAEIGQPAGHELQKRFEALKIERNALQRNFEESKLHGQPDLIKLEKVQALLRHIEQEESSVERDARFLGEVAPSSMILAVEAGAHIVDLCRRGVHKVLGDRHPLGASVFVNHTHESLTSELGLTDQPDAADAATKEDATKNNR